ncbi:uncharacterized protein Z520_01916 [Fonsecaea multimorphosa CBS 102226]|uniref:protein-ribulosamine 3-kinase n=1 Tax=Fonsecaea multimorphosa CBS 102226 TaxID=1442371 RepID=A0A0D2K765_9EURO|nr:uncharacterized protein Z520_01916 [Fonsecaea multimorphosa CBS 102226]KIY01778.1 hypothetical protein Z520_01916 [Fonsecaea multimorphosa CBS 102226]
MRITYILQADFIPESAVWGSYQSSPDTHFFHDCPNCTKSSKVSEWQFQISHHNLQWQPTAVERLGGQLGDILYEEHVVGTRPGLKVRAPDPYLDTLTPTLIEKAIPRLLRPPESEDRSVKPSLVHGDLWYANSGVDADTGYPLVFDACCFYGHNEYEFGQWMPTCNRFGAPYLMAYRSYVQISLPQEDYQGRLDLYKLCKI